MTFIEYTNEVVWVGNVRIQGGLQVEDGTYNLRLVVRIASGNVTRLFIKRYNTSLDAAYDFDLLFLHLASYMSGERLTAFLASRP